MRIDQRGVEVLTRFGSLSRQVDRADLGTPDMPGRFSDVGSSPGVSRAAVRARTRSLARLSKRRHPIVSAQQEMIDSSDENGVWM